MGNHPNNPPESRTRLFHGAGRIVCWPRGLPLSFPDVYPLQGPVSADSSSYLLVICGTRTGSQVVCRGRFGPSVGMSIGQGVLQSRSAPDTMAAPDFSATYCNLTLDTQNCHVFPIVRDQTVYPESHSSGNLLKPGVDSHLIHAEKCQAIYPNNACTGRQSRGYVV